MDRLLEAINRGILKGLTENNIELLTDLDNDKLDQLDSIQTKSVNDKIDGTIVTVRQQLLQAIQTKHIDSELKNKLNKHGVDVILTRDGDFDLSSPNAFRRKKSDFDNRINLINSSGADLYLSFHINYLDDSRYYGAQVFYTEGNEEIAEILQDSMNDNLDSPLKEKKLNSSIYMYKQLVVPGVLIECGFLSNDKERKLLVNKEYQNRIINTVVEGLLNYYKKRNL